MYLNSEKVMCIGSALLLAGFLSGCAQPDDQVITQVAQLELAGTFSKKEQCLSLVTTEQNNIPSSLRGNCPNSLLSFFNVDTSDRPSLDGQQNEGSVTAENTSDGTDGGQSGTDGPASGDAGTGGTSGGDIGTGSSDGSDGSDTGGSSDTGGKGNNGGGNGSEGISPGQGSGANNDEG